MKFLLLTVIVVGTMFVWPDGHVAAQAKKKTTPIAAATKAAAGSQAKILATRMMLIERKKAVRDQLQRSMTLKEEKIHHQSTDYETKKDLYAKNLISKSELEDSERALATTRQETERIREWIAEDDRALALVEQTAEEELQGDARALLVRYDGKTNWSLASLEKISRFFRQRFGRPLPISAMGQSDTHDRLGLDHRDSVDIALRPDSAEGRDLMAYLRQSGIPFMAFRGKLSSRSTGAHIHIGHPSPRLAQVKQQSTASSRHDSVQDG